MSSGRIRATKQAAITARFSVENVTHGAGEFREGLGERRTETGPGPARPTAAPEISAKVYTLCESLPITAR